MNTELLYSWGIGIIIMLTFLVPYISSMKKKDALTRKRLEETRAKRQDKALLQHPIINQSLCIGCGICVDACPEGTVLGLIDGKATIIHGSHCVGHGKCAEACPVSGIEIGLGDISQREDIPQLSEHFESNIPGLYIIGELSGLALIKNAITHGVTAINHIHENQTQKDKGEFDVVIIGAGPAGLSAGLRAKELELNYLILDQDKPGGTILQYPRRKLVLVQPVELPLFGSLKKGEYEKEDLLAIWEKVISEQKVKLLSGHQLKGISGEHGNFTIETSSGPASASRVILALGRRGTPRKLGIPGESLSKVMYKLMDAETYKHKKLLVVGGGDSAIEAALGLAHQEGNEVTLSYRKENFFRIKARNEKNIEKAIEDQLLNVVFESNPSQITESNVTLKTADTEMVLDNDFTFIFAGGELPFPLLNSIGIEFGKKIEAKT
ncbi:MAG: NAD(P)-binding domain-containing protein [Candidatus Marinimicrobia bacterium]|jgi:thioredoxin reductase|nr:NAD(P)-binding domain-containing protein [Candidatus Neomarinimicrobiota bacterium]MBT3496258.1 NAD(P)-binding domain-containing protein [Candidatus Neomarinimicrobiota bacterium]MBT3692695.1 NAD(P)-binding domain-containing protein [Candidatus Neomarinimicrobiota bacterium]MBT3731981.1 NAD(P)-binding domain-containing protein [Candidatus Neomarinimicrobiota bacterium]MBT4144982.1 NAD(P)-binding domain-containing protein [Candidatus Neomarinimicrobiota bacterium]